MKRHHWLLLLGLILLAVVLFTTLLILTASPSIAPTRPSAAELDNETLKVASQLYCPVCPNTPLDVCETQACQQWRALIRDKLAAGQSSEQIRQYFVAEFGERVLGAPEPQGFNLGIYILPVAAIAAGAIALYLAVRRRMARPPVSAASPGPADAYREQIERDLKESK